MKKKPVSKKERIIVLLFANILGVVLLIITTVIRISIYPNDYPEKLHIYLYGDVCGIVPAYRALIEMRTLDKIFTEERTAAEQANIVAMAKHILIMGGIAEQTKTLFMPNCLWETHGTMQVWMLSDVGYYTTLMQLNPAGVKVSAGDAKIAETSYHQKWNKYFIGGWSVFPQITYKYLQTGVLPQQEH